LDAVIELQAEVIQFLIHTFIADYEFKPLRKQRGYALIALLQQSGTTLLQQRLRFHFHHFFLPYKASMPFLDGQDAALFAK
jgi:hypothetical protein